MLEAGARSRRVYLPAGTWKNVDTGEILTGGATVKAPAPIDVMSVFMKM